MHSKNVVMLLDLKLIPHKRAQPGEAMGSEVSPHLSQVIVEKKDKQF